MLDELARGKMRDMFICFTRRTEEISEACLACADSDIVDQNFDMDSGNYFHGVLNLVSLFKVNIKK